MSFVDLLFYALANRNAIEPVLLQRILTSATDLSVQLVPLKQGQLAFANEDLLHDDTLVNY